MSIELLIAFNLTLLAAFISPGPAMLVSFRAILVYGRAAGLKTGIGLAIMSAIWTSAALLGLNSIFDIFPWAYAFLKTAGAIYLLYIAWKIWISAKQPLDGNIKVGRSHMREGLLVNLANPKSVLFAAAVLVVIFPPDLNLAEKAIIVGNHFLVEVTGYAFFAYTMSTQAISRRYMHARKWLDRFSAVVLSGLGLKLLLQR